MKYLALITFILLICYQTEVSSQSCLPEGITFSTQAKIDNFQTNYPGCSTIEGDVMIYGSNITNLNGLSVLTSIGGYLKIDHNFNLTNLVGLDNVTSIGRYLWIKSNYALTSFVGLGNITSIGGNLEIIHNDIPISLIGLDNVISIGEDLNISYNSALTSLSGLDNVTSIGSDIKIVDNNALTSLTGLESLDSIGGDLTIRSNDALTSLTGLENLDSIGGNLLICDNTTLTSLTGLENINAASITNLYIYENNSLATCEAQSICDYLFAPNGSVNIYNNAPGCNNPIEVANICGLALSCLPFGNYYFLSQNEIDNFQTNNPGCTDLEGNVFIQGSDITNLNGLNVVTSIGGNIWVAGNAALISLSGLNNLDSIGGDLRIDYNSALTELTGLNNLSSIRGDLFIHNNDALISLTGLEHLDSIGENLDIKYNIALTSLSGLENINLASITNLFINDNNSLATCEVQSICDYLSAPSGSVNIYNNAPGCNNPTEIANACGLTLSCLPYGNYWFFTQTDIDNFQTNYPDCTELGGYVLILNGFITNLGGLSMVTSIGEGLHIYHNRDLSSLSGLENLHSISGKLYITSNPDLNSLMGLNNLDSIGGYLDIYNNNALTSLTGLNNLGSIGGNFSIHFNDALTSFTGLGNLGSIGGDFGFGNNDALTSLTGVNNLDSIGGKLYINYNNSLTSLAGLENINAASITNLLIYNNNSLATCEVQSICNYLSAPSGTSEIYGNVLGCNGPDEVKEACETVSIDEVYLSESLLIYPNPLANSATISYKLMEPGKVTLSIYNYLGQQMETLVNQYQQIGKHQVIWNAEGLTSGIYFFRLQAGQEIATRKILVIH